MDAAHQPLWAASIKGKVNRLLGPHSPILTHMLYKVFIISSLQGPNTDMLNKCKTLETF